MTVVTLEEAATPARYTEELVAAALARKTFAGSLVVVDRCTWPGHECDLLVVTLSLRVIEVEVKISRADLRADRKKDKWFTWSPGSVVNGTYVAKPAIPREWPRKVWKHYYAVAAPVWKPDLLDAISPRSGVITVDLGSSRPVEVIRRAQPNRDCTPISAADAVNIARLASLRMWDAYEKLEAIRSLEQ